MKAFNSTIPTKRLKPRRKGQEAPNGEGASVLHQGPFRSPELLALASMAPHCMHCWVANHGQIVACHSNSQMHGKGMGVKAHDIPAYLCDECHSILDGRLGTLTRHEKTLMFLYAVYETWLWLMRAGHLEVKK